VGYFVGTTEPIELIEQIEPIEQIELFEPHEQKKRPPFQTAV
jgi:hypothetical protein